MAIEDDTKELSTDKRHVDSNKGISTCRLLSESIVQREIVQLEAGRRAHWTNPPSKVRAARIARKRESKGAAEELFDSGKSTTNERLM